MTSHIKKLPSLLDITLDDIASGLDSGNFTSVDLVEAYIARIREVNDDFHAVIEINPNAIKVAQSLDEERSISGRRGPLHGVPILLKDNIFTNEPTQESAGSYALLGAKPAHEAVVASKLREAGAILLGTSNLSEWANYRSEKSSNGWSARGGQCYGAYLPTQDPSGSSSGSGTATTLGLAFAAIGTETDGSITYPSGKANIVGIKPTLGLVSRNSVIPISFRQDTVGPMARTVKDATLILNAMSGKTSLDEATLKIPFEPIPDFSASCKTTDLKNFRIGVPRISFFDENEALMAAFEDALKIIEGAGATIVDNVEYPSAEEFHNLDDKARGFVMAGDFKVAINSILSTLVENPQNIKNLDDLIEFTKSCPEEEYQSRNIERFLDAQKCDLESPEYKIAFEKNLFYGGEGGILNALEKHRLDLLVVPSVSAVSISFAAKMGFPVISIPLGFYPEGTNVEMNDRGDLVKLAPGMPFCISFIGKAFTEEKLIQVAYVFEQLTNVRAKRLPYKLPKTDLQDIVARRG